MRTALKKLKINHLGIILTEFPKRVNPLDLKISGQPFIKNYKWRPEQGTRFRVIDKKTGEIVRNFETEAFFGFHHVNAFEAADSLNVDLVTYPDASIIDMFYLDNLRNNPFGWKSELTRFRLDLSTGDIERQSLSDVPLELPRFHYVKHGGEDYRYVYGSSQKKENHFLDSIAKIDVKNKTANIWEEEMCYPGEPVFIPAPNAETEDDGVLLSVTLDAEKNTSFLLILDAGDLSELARAQVPHRIPFGFHGEYFA